MKKLMNRVIATVITLTMAFSMMPVAAFADIASTTTSVKTAKDANGKEYYTEIVLEPYTFYDVGGGAKQKLNEATVTNLVKNQLLYNWVDIANGCFRTAGECASVDYENYGQYFNTGSPAYDCFGEVRGYLRGLEANKGNVSRNNFWRTGIRVASNLGQVRQIMADQIAGQIDHKPCKAEDILKQGPVPSGSRDGSALEEMRQDTSQGTVVYSIATSINRYSANRFRYNSFGIAFYDFQPRPIQADDLVYKTAADGYDNMEEAAKGNPGEVSFVKDFSSEDKDKSLWARNESSKTVTQTLSLSTNESATVTNSFENASSYSFSESIGYSISWGTNTWAKKGVQDLVSQTLSFEFKSEQMYSSTEGHSKSESHSREASASQSVTMEPQTSVVMSTETGTSTFTTNYDTPVMISYKVAIFSLTGDVYADNIASCYYGTAGYKHGYYYNVFGGNAAFGISASENLHVRAVENQATGRGDASSAVVRRYYKNNGGSSYNTDNVGVDWYSGFMATDGPTHAAAMQQATRIPMMSCGCSYSVTGQTIKDTVGEMQPLYLPRKFVLSAGEDDYELTAGDNLNLSKQLGISCVNKNDIPYYGFNKNHGQWVVCDNKGNPVTSDIISISTTGTGNQVLNANSPGSAYITWRLKDGVKYKSVDESGVITNASNLPSPIIEINVKSNAFKGSVEVTGDYTGCVGDKGVNLFQVLTASAYDETGKKVKAPMVWEAKEMPEDGIEVAENGDLTMTKDGTFHVRAVVRNTTSTEDDVRSEWHAIEVQRMRQLEKVELSVPAEEDTHAVMAKPATSVCIYDLSSYLKGFDQYGDPWTGSLDNVSFDINTADKDKVRLDGNMLYITGQASCEVWPVINGKESDDLNVGSVSFSVSDNLVNGSDRLDLYVGQAGQIQISDFTGNMIPEGLTYKSDNTDVAQVSEDGIVTAVGIGYAEITIEDGVGGKEICQVNVSAAPKPVSSIRISGLLALSADQYTYNGKVQKPALVTTAESPLTEGTDYKAEWSDSGSKNAGTYKVTVSGIGKYTGKEEFTYKINKAGNSLTAKGKNVKVSLKKLKKKAQTIKGSKVLTVSNGEGKVSYKLESVTKPKFKKYFKVNSKNGNITVKKGLKKGSYKLKIQVAAAGDGNHANAAKNVTTKVSVK